MRQTEGSMLCPHCGKLIGVNEERCPFCGAWRPGMFGYMPTFRRWSAQIDFTRVIIAACATLYLASLLLQPSAIFSSNGIFNILSPSGRALYQLGMTGGASWHLHYWWTLLTAIYLHGSLMHIFFNMMVVWNIAPAVANVYGPARTFVIWTIAGVAGFLVSNLITGSPSVGASGSVFGLFAALIVYGRRVHHSVLTAQIWQWVIINFVIGFFISNVNVVAHAGGFAGGWLASMAVHLDSEKRESLAVQALAGALVLATLAGFVLSFIKVTSLLRAGG
jgi:rhomboid protease GluP